MIKGLEAAGAGCQQWSVSGHLAESGQYHPRAEWDRPLGDKLSTEHACELRSPISPSCLFLKGATLPLHMRKRTPECQGSAAGLLLVIPGRARPC